MSDWRDITDEKEKYAAYLCSREWAELKRAVHARAGGKCERCGERPIDAVHHLNYRRKYKERLTDLQGICDPCHEFTHAKSDKDPKDESGFAIEGRTAWSQVAGPQPVEDRHHDSSCIECDVDPANKTMLLAIRTSHSKEDGSSVDVICEINFEEAKALAAWIVRIQKSVTE